MDRAHRLLALVIASILFPLSCDQPFDANGPVDQHLVVFTILSTDRTSQVVRVTAPFLTSDYRLVGNELFENSVTDATVNIFIPPYYILDYYHFKVLVEGQRLQLRDTVLARPGAGASAPPYHVYTTSAFTPVHGLIYQVHASSPQHGSVSGSIKLPMKPTITIPWSSHEIMNSPHLHDPTATIDFLATLPDSGGGYLARLYLDYEVVKEGEWTNERVELPISSADPTTFSLVHPVYPGLIGSRLPKSIRVSFLNGYLRNIIKALVDDKYAGKPIIFDRITMTLLQADPNLYSYYAAAQVERDPRSIRLDQLSVAKLSGGGYGLIGGYTLDSAMYPLPEYFYANHR